MKAELVEGPVLRQLLKLALPMTFGIFTIICFSLVDTFFVAQLGEAELAAMAFTFPVPMVITSMAFAIGVAVSSLVSRALGEGDESKVKRLATHSLLLALFLAMLFCATGLATIDPLFAALGASPEVLVHIRDYMQIWYLGMPLIVVPMVGNSVIRALGNATFPALVMAAAGLVNGLLDPVLIFGWGIVPAMGLQGAAIATVAAQFSAFLAGLLVIHRKYALIVSPMRACAPLTQSWTEVGKLAFPVFLSNLIAPFATAIVTRLVSQYGSAVVAGYGVGSRIESFLGIPLMGVSAALGPFVGQNYGARRYERIRRAIFLSNGFVWIWASFCVVLMLFFAESVSGIFNSDQMIQEASRDYLMIVTVGLMGTGILQNAVSVFNVLGQPRVALFISLFKVGVLYIPFALLLQFPWQQNGIYFAALSSHLGAGVVIYLYLRRAIGSCQDSRPNIEGFRYVPRSH